MHESSLEGYASEVCGVLRVERRTLCAKCVRGKLRVRGCVVCVVCE